MILVQPVIPMMQVHVRREGYGTVDFTGQRMVGRKKGNPQRRQQQEDHKTNRDFLVGVGQGTCLSDSVVKLYLVDCCGIILGPD